VIVGEADDGPKALALIRTHRPDVAFLDIRMPGLTGLEVARSLDVPTQVVFVTAYDSHALEAFEANAIDYVLKPVDPVRIDKVLAKLKRSVHSNTQDSVSVLLEKLQKITGKLSEIERDTTKDLTWLQVAVGSQVRMVHINDVIYFESDTKYTRVVADDCDGLIRTSLKDLLEAVDPTTFLKTHRGIVVNRRFVRSVYRQGEVVEIELKGRAEKLKVSTANHHLFRAM
jgi:DNA-binding LytR/AlgR family response regulator